MSFKLRDYQSEALTVIDEALKTDPNVLFQAIMGAGKTVMTARLVNKYWFNTGRKFLILAHKQELVEQFHNTFLKFTDVPAQQIGICCAGLNQNDISKRLTVGTIQTFVNVIDDYKGCDLFVIDECHRVSIDTDTQYKKVIDNLKQKNKYIRILGITATPFRLGHGYIYGDRCAGKNLFEKLHYQISYNDLKEEGYLCGLQGKIANHDSLESDLSAVDISGDYVLNQLGDVMCREVHLKTAVDAIKEYCINFKMICVFCTTIDHAEKLKDLINGNIGDICTTIHSNLGQLERFSNMKSWRSGKKKICTSVNILAEGFDFPPLDCLVFARPTLSPVLFLQAVGRVLRLHESKEYGFLLDLTDNTSRFGTDLDNVRITIPKSVIKKELKEDENIKICPNCQELILKVLRQCNKCGYIWPAAEITEAANIPVMKDVTFTKAEPEWVTVIDWDIYCWTTKKDKELGCIKLFYGTNIYKPEYATVWLCFRDYYTGYAVQKAEKWWKKFTGEGTEEYFPDDCNQFLERINFLRKPDEALIDDSGEFTNIVDIKYNDDLIPF